MKEVEPCCRPALLDRYLEEAKAEELAAEWSARGYEVERNADICGTTADLVARKGDETVIFEIKTYRGLPLSRDSVRSLQALTARDPKVQFRLVVANPPRAKRIRMPALQSVLLDYLLQAPTPPELDALSSHTSVEWVDDIEVLDTTISADEVSVAGEGSVGVRLQYGSDGDVDRDDGLVDHDAFPFSFAVVLGRDLKLMRVDRLVIDTASFYA